MKNAAEPPEADKPPIEKRKDVAVSIRLADEQHNWEHVAPGLRITVSAGIAFYRSRAQRQTAGTYGMSARALYAGKRGGRNRFVLASDPTVGLAAGR